MKAITYHRYGSPDVLHPTEVKMPIPRKHEVLVRVRAASINSWDWDMIRGSPWIVRMWGLFGPRFTVPGADVAGVVEAVGKDVTRYRIGDLVFGDLAESGWGGFAEYATAPETALAHIPPSMTFEEAAALPQAGLMALQSVCDEGRISKGQKLLMNGAAGGVGSIAIQLAKMVGAHVTAVDHHAKHPFLLELGADRVIDYQEIDYTSLNDRYDLIVDVVAHSGLRKYKNCLQPGGKFLMIGGSMPAILKAMMFGRWVSDEQRKVGILAYKSNRGLDELARLCHAGAVRPVIDKVFPLSKTAEAFQYFATGQVRGKIVIVP